MLAAAFPIVLTALASKLVGADPTGLSLPYITQDAWAQDVLRVHNNYRAIHGAQPLTWNNDLANFAVQNAAQYDWAHTVNDPYGENKACATYLSPDTLMYNWYHEVTQYDYNNPGFSLTTGHFTQVVWQGTQQVGCALVKTTNAINCPYSMTCEYYPHGNVLTQFAQNVKPPVSSAASTTPMFNYTGILTLALVLYWLF